MKSLRYLILNLGVLLLVAGCQHAGAPSQDMSQKFFSSLTNSNPEAERTLQRAQYYSLMGRDDLALQELNHALDLDPQNTKLLNAAGGFYDKLGNHIRARELYEKVLAQDAANNTAQNNLGYSCYLAGEFSRAEKIFQEILALQPEDTLARNNLGLVWCRQGKEKEALTLWQKSEGEIRARERLQQVLAFLGKPADAAAGGASPNTGILPGDTAPLARTLDNQRYMAAGKPETAPLPKSLAKSAPSPRPADKPRSVAGSLSPAPPALPVKVEEVTMVVEPASYAPGPTAMRPADGGKAAPPASKSLPRNHAPGQIRPLPSGALPDEELLTEEAEPLPHAGAPRHSRKYNVRAPKIITWAPPAPPAPIRSMENYLNQISIFQPRPDSGRQETPVF